MSNFKKTIPTIDELVLINRVFTKPRRASLITIRALVSKVNAPGRSRDPELGTVYDLSVTLPYIALITNQRCMEALKDALEDGLSLKTLVRCDLSIPMNSQPIMQA